MRTEFEQQDIDAIALKVLELLKPLLSANTKKEDSDIIFTPESLAEYLKVDVSWVYKQVSLKTIPYFKNGKYTRFKKNKIDRWIEKNTVEPIPSKIMPNKWGVNA